MKTIRLIGIMSGTSLDGIDLICVDFRFNKHDIEWNILAAECYDYSIKWRNVLANAHQLAAQELLILDADYGRFLGENVNKFIKVNQLRDIDGIASHGHTVFHQPEKGFTLQIGHGAHIQAVTKIQVISDFRSQDVALGGQGAPLVPIGDKLLFPQNDACVNLGGFANISFDNNIKRRIAFDICPVNFILNHLCQKLGKAYDNEGEIAKNSRVDVDLLDELNQIQFYQQPPPKSLGREWVEENIYPLLENSNISIQDNIATFSNHVAFQIAEILNQNQLQKVLISGGGAKNLNLIMQIQQLTDSEIIIANDQITNYKEALIFALLGALRLQNKVNVWSSVTGAERDSSSGIIYG